MPGVQVEVQTGRQVMLMDQLGSVGVPAGVGIGVGGSHLCSWLWQTPGRQVGCWVLRQGRGWDGEAGQEDLRNTYSFCLFKFGLCFLI